MSDSLTAEKPLYCATYMQTWENYLMLNKELYKQKVRKMIAASFAVLTIVGTAFMAADRLQLLGRLTYCAAILLLVGLPFIWRHTLFTQFRSANVKGDEEWQYVFYQDSFKLNSKNTVATRRYSELYRIVEGTEYIYLLPEMNRVFPVPRDHGERDKFLLSQGKQREKDKIAPFLSCFYVLSSMMTAFYGLTAERLPKQWLLQTWVYVICAAMPLAWMITIVLAGVSRNLYHISYVRKTWVRIILQVLSVLFCGLLILCLGIGDVLSLALRYPVQQNDNGTYTEHVDDMYAPFKYYLYQPEGAFFLRYLRPMTDLNDTDPTISESEWYRRMDTKSTDTSTDASSKPTEPIKNSSASGSGSASTRRNSEAEKERNAALKIFDKYFAAKGSTFKESYTAKGRMYFVLHESAADITYLEYDRDSRNGNCGLYVLLKAAKSSDGSWSQSEAQMQNTYAYEYSTGAIVESGKVDWSDSGNEEYRKLTGEP